MGMREDFAAFILTHGRPDRVYTYDTIRKAGYTGRIYLVIDNEDKQAEAYRQRFGDAVLMFDKAAVAQTFDEGDNFKDRRTIIYARNAVFELARQQDVRYFIQLDDDYTGCEYRRNHKLQYITKPILHSLDAVWSALVAFVEATPIHTLCMAQGGDFIGGKQNARFSKRMQLYRKAMNTFICDVNKPFQFIGRINEDVNTYTSLQRAGMFMATTPQVNIVQKTTQRNKGGMTDTYLASGTYVKSFYSVMYAPSCVRISMMGDNHRRVHHQVAWRYTAPLLVRESLQKATV